MQIKGKRVKISPIKLDDIYTIKNWGEHNNPLFFDYNLPPLTHRDMKEWYKSKVSIKNNRYYGVFNKNNELIGYLGVKNIRRFWKDSVLGIVFDPNYMNQGYGTETITSYLNYYFNEIKMRAMYLEVMKFNKRAIRCYEKCGFYKISEYLDLFFNQRINRNNKYFLEERDSFEIIDGKIYNYIYKMKVDRKTYIL